MTRFYPGDRVRNTVSGSVGMVKDNCGGDDCVIVMWDYSKDDGHLSYPRRSYLVPLYDNPEQTIDRMNEDWSKL
jgi:hypothetical protein